MGGARPPPFTITTITYKVVVYTLQLRGQIHSLYFYSTPICTLCSTLYTISPPVNKVWPSSHTITHTHSHNNMGFHFLFKAELDLARIATPLGRGKRGFSFQKSVYRPRFLFILPPSQSRIEYSISLKFGFSLFPRNSTANSFRFVNVIIQNNIFKVFTVLSVPLRVYRVFSHAREGAKKVGLEVHPSFSNLSFFPATVSKIGKELTKSRSWGEGRGLVDLVEEHPVHLSGSCYK